jgi:hypothetical protein
VASSSKPSATTALRRTSGDFNSEAEAQDWIIHKSAAFFKARALASGAMLLNLFILFDLEFVETKLHLK